MAGRVVVVPYDPEWPARFERLRRLLTEVLGALAQRIEHVGSTAVPGLMAKPIIDLDVVIGSRALLPAAYARLASVGYVDEGDLGVADREAFRAPDGLPAHHLYVCPADSRALREHLLFRDYLRSHPEAAQAYGILKRRLAALHGADRQAYTAGKTAFVQAILQRCQG
jgi:GrpB-like predicted nucleotidyltransferase (UPF0157 family)